MGAITRDEMRRGRDPACCGRRVRLPYRDFTAGTLPCTLTEHAAARGATSHGGRDCAGADLVVRHRCAVASPPDPTPAQQLRVCVLPRAGRWERCSTGAKNAYAFSLADGFLLYLSLYADLRLPLLNATQARAFAAWDTRFNDEGGAVAVWIEAAASGAEPITPGALFGAARDVCSRSYPPSTAGFCAAITLHNVLRTLGRTSTYIGKDGTNYLPHWYRDDPSRWAQATPRVQARLISLRADGGGDRWGEWYHTAGVVAYAMHEAALLSLAGGELVTRVVVALNQIFNPCLAGGPEDPIKARIDRDAAQVGALFAASRAAPAPGNAPEWRRACVARRGYVEPPPRAVATYSSLY